MTPPMTPREKVARAIQAHDNDHVPDGYANGLSDEVSDWSAYLADRVLTALASGSGDHAELARLAAEANQPMPAKRRAGWWRRKARFEAAFTPSVCSALLAENAALLDYGKSAAKEALEYRVRATEAEHKLAEAVGLLGKIAEHKPFGDGSEYRTDYRIGHDNAGSYAADLARSFLSKEAERG